MAIPAVALGSQISSQLVFTPFFPDDTKAPRGCRSTMPNEVYGHFRSSSSPTTTPPSTKSIATLPEMSTPTPPVPFHGRTHVQTSEALPQDDDVTLVGVYKEVKQSSAQAAMKESDERGPSPSLPIPDGILDVPEHVAIAADGPFGLLIKETVELRDRVMSKRIGLEISEGNYNAQWKHTTHHLDNFMTAATGLMDVVAKLLPSSSHDELKQSFEQLNASAAHLRKWQNEGKSLGKDLTKWEGSLQTKEEALYLYLLRMVPDTAVSEYASSDGADTMNWERLSDSTANTDPLEHDYYDRIGDVNIIREHVYNFDADHHRRIYQREWAIKTGEFVASPNDKNMYLQYVRERRDLVKEYIDAKQDMERLKNLCHKKGLNVEEPDLPPFLDLSQRIERPPTPPVRVREIAFKKYGAFDPDIYLRFGGLDNKTRILRWREIVRKAVSDEKKELASEASSRSSSVQTDAPLALPPSPTLTKPKFNHDLPIPSRPELEISDTPGEVDPDADLPRFDKIQGDAPTRRYSEPSISVTIPNFRRDLGLRSESFQEKSTAKSETELNILMLPSRTGHQAEFVIEPPSAESRALKLHARSVSDLGRVAS